MLNLKNLLIRNTRAHKLGFMFIRSKSFKIPKSMRVNDKTYYLSIPSFQGVEELFRDIILDDEYFLRKLPSEEIRTIVDVGANVGIFSIASRIFFPTSEIHSYEPNEDNFLYLDAQAESFNFLTFQEAVSNHNGYCNLEKRTIHDTSARIININGTTKCVDLDTVNNRFKSKSIDLLKLDCEGSEFNILSNTSQLTSFKYITLEYHISEDNSLSTLTELLIQANFKILHVDERNELLGNILAKNAII